MGTDGLIIVGAAIALQIVTFAAYIDQRFKANAYRHHADRWCKEANRWMDDYFNLLRKIRQQDVNCVRRDPKTGRYLKTRSN